MSPTIPVRLAFCVLWVAVAAAGCTSMQPVVQATSEVESEVAVGDIVRVVTRDGRELELEVTALDDDSLAGEVRKGSGDPDAPAGAPTEIAYEEIKTLHVRRTDGWKTAGYVGGSLVLGYLIGLALVSALVIIPL